MKALIGREQDDALQAALEQRDIDCLFVKLLDIQPIAVPDLAQRLRRAQAVLLTSANAVPALAAARRDLPILAVGDATAQAARDSGFTSVESAEGDIAALAGLVKRRSDPGGGALLYARGADVAGDLVGQLSGYSVDQAVVYRASPATQLSEAARAALAGDTLDFVALFSPRSAAAFVNLVQSAQLADRCHDITLIAFSPAVARAVESLPWAGTHVGAHPSREFLLTMIDMAIKTRGEHEQR